MKLAELVEQRNVAVKEMRSYLEKGDTVKFDEIDAKVVELDKQIAALKKLEDAEKVQAAFADTRQPPMSNIAPHLVDGGRNEEWQKTYSKVFSKYLRGNISSLSPEEQQIMLGTWRDAGGTQIRAAQTESTTGGGYIIPQGFSGQLEEAMKWYGGIDGIVDSFETDTGNPLPWPTINDTTNKGRILGLNTQVTETDLVFGQIMFGAFTFCSDSILIPIQLMRDSYFDLDKEVAKLLGIRLGRLFNNKFTVGAGTTEPLGIVTAALNAPGGGLTYTTASGQTSTIIGDDLINLEHTVDPAYRPGGRYMLADSTLKAIKKLKDSYGRYLWLPGLAANDPNTINGYKYVINQDMAALGTSGSPVTGNAFLLFGDMSKYKVRRVAGDTTVMRLTERYADYLQVGYQAFLRADAQLLDAGTHPIAVAVQATS
jgi:HK97 family phage major capsid protein